jgi:hypothetical protein
MNTRFNFAANSSVWPDVFVAVTSPVHTENAADRLNNLALPSGIPRQIFLNY